MKSNRLDIGLLLSLALVAVLLAAVGLTVAAMRVRNEEDGRRELARLGLEDVARRVTQNVRNLKAVRAMSDTGALARARAFAAIIAAEPDILDRSNRTRFEAVARDLGVDELHVSDAKGVLVRSIPTVYEGFAMGSAEQSAAFMPAITNVDFALVQEPRVKGHRTGDDRYDKVFQYAGVARRDQPGIVQIGYRAERVGEAMKLADVADIAATTRVGRDGRVLIAPRQDDDPPVVEDFREVTDSTGRRVSIVESECEGYRIRVMMPFATSFFSGPRMVEKMIVLDIILLLFVVVSLPSSRRALRHDIEELRAQLAFNDKRRSSLRRVLTSPLALVSYVLYAALVTIIAIVTTRQALFEASERLRTASTDIVSDLNDCADNQLVFVGKAICSYYGTPEAIDRKSVV